MSTKEMIEGIEIIDSHTHCGIQNAEGCGIFDLVKGFDDLKVNTVCIFSPAGDIYDRGDKDFENLEVSSQEYVDEWNECRRKANTYCLEIGKSKELQDEIGFKVVPYYFVWNDFSIPDDGFCGIKWHRHGNEASIEYDSPKCERFLQHIYKMKIPIVYEDTFENTLSFIERVNGNTDIIIPHFGMLNGGYYKLGEKGIWEKDFVYLDTSLVCKEMIYDHISKKGCDKVIWGSDWPTGNTKREIQKILEIPLKKEDLKKILSLNIQKLWSKKRMIEEKMK